jgi:hypothetical protein
MKRVLVTAINSPLDQKLVELLITENYIVRIMATDVHAGSLLLKLPIEIFPANLLQTASVMQSVKGCDYIIQTATAIDDKNNVQKAKYELQQTMLLPDAAMPARIKTIMHLQLLSSNHIMDEGRSCTTSNHLTKTITPTGFVLPVAHQLSLQPISINLKKIRVLLAHISTESTVENNGTISLHDAAIAIIGILTKGKHGKTYIVGNIPAPHITVQQRMFLMTAIPFIVFRKAVVHAGKRAWSRLHSLSKLLGLTLWWQYDYPAAW